MKVSVGYVHSTELSASFHESLIGLIMYDLGHDCLTAHDSGKLALRCGTDGLVAARNMMAAAFLKSDSDWLLVLDSDMGFHPDTLYQLLAVADPETRPIVGGLCFASREMDRDGMGGFSTAPRATIYDWTEMADGHTRFVARVTYPISAVVPCHGTGSACILIHRSVFEKLEHGTWYDRLRGTDGSLLGEDISFCARVGQAGIPIHVHTGVRTTHLKPRWLGESDFWRQYLPPPATEMVDVIVPVLHRPQNVKPFMESLLASTGMARAIFVVDPDDLLVMAEVEKYGGRYIVHAGTFAEKVNYADGVDDPQAAPWVFLVGDDVRFHPGWLDHAQHVGRLFGAQVVGTNDLGNPAVLAGEHAVHMLIRREYIDEVGASWDGPGVVCHEGYGHWFVDNEIVTAAKQRGVWSMAIGSIVEHMHPLFGKGENDAVYDKGRETDKADHILFKKRYARSEQQVPA